MLEQDYVLWAMPYAQIGKKVRRKYLNLPEEDKKDLIQNVALQVWKYRDRAVVGNELHHGYVNCIIKGALRDHYGRQEKRNDPVHSGDLSEEEYLVTEREEPDPKDECEAHQLYLLFLKVSHSLAKGLRKSVCECLLAGLSTGQEIAHALGAEIKPVSQALSYVRKRLRDEARLQGYMLS